MQNIFMRINRAWTLVKQQSVAFGIVGKNLAISTPMQGSLGIVVPELEHERAESLPFNKQPSKRDGRPSQGTQSLRLF
jgi:hypothetical protein